MTFGKQSQNHSLSSSLTISEEDSKLIDRCVSFDENEFYNLQEESAFDVSKIDLGHHMEKYQIRSKNQLIFQSIEILGHKNKIL